MAGKIFAKLEVDWILGTDENSDKWRSLCPSARCLYITLWCLAVANRKETIKRPSNTHLASISGLSANHLNVMLDSLAAIGLSSHTHDTITIFHVAKKHPKFNMLKNQMKSNETGEAISELELDQNKNEIKSSPLKSPQGDEIKGEPKNKPIPHPEKMRETWDAYPPTPKGRNGRKLFERQWKARVEEGEDPNVLLKTVRNFAIARASEDSAFTMSIQKFIGRDKHYLGFVGESTENPLVYDKNIPEWDRGDAAWHEQVKKIHGGSNG